MPTETVSPERAEQILATAAQYMMETDRPEFAKDLASCEVVIYLRERGYRTILKGSADFAKRYRDEQYPDYAAYRPIHEALKEAFELCLPRKDYNDISVGIGLREFDENWRTQLVAEQDSIVNNQNPWLTQDRAEVWHGIRFDKSAPGEKAIAQALERAGIMYLPNCLVRVGPPNNQQTFFPDFLICYQGKWGILEVDGKTYHRESATQDYERMRKLIKDLDYFDRYPSDRCLKEPDAVVKEFLSILARRR